MSATQASSPIASVRNTRQQCSSTIHVASVCRACRRRRCRRTGRAAPSVHGRCNQAGLCTPHIIKIISFQCVGTQNEARSSSTALTVFYVPLEWPCSTTKASLRDLPSEFRINVLSAVTQTRRTDRRRSLSRLCCNQAWKLIL